MVGGELLDEVGLDPPRQAELADRPLVGAERDDRALGPLIPLAMLGEVEQGPPEAGEL